MKEVAAFIFSVLVFVLLMIVTDFQLDKLDEFVCNNVKCLKAAE